MANGNAGTIHAVADKVVQLEFFSGPGVNNNPSIHWYGKDPRSRAQNSPAFNISSLGAQQKSHAQYAENTFLQDDVDSVFRFSFDQMVSVFHGLLFTYLLVFSVDEGSQNCCQIATCRCSERVEQCALQM